METKKELHVLICMYNINIKYRYRTDRSIHTNILVYYIFSKETIKEYGLAKAMRLSVLYLGRMAKKDYVQSEYKRIGGYTYFNGYYLRPKGIDVLKSINIIKHEK